MYGRSPLRARLWIPAASFSTSQEQLRKVDFGDMQTLMERDHFVKIKKRIEKDVRRRITIQEFKSMCGEEGLSEDQATRLCQSLNDSGVILHFPNSTNKKMQETLFLQPQELNATVHNLLEHYSPAALKLQAEATQAEIRQLKEEVAPLKDVRQEMERKAARRANTIVFAGLGYCVLQFLAIGRLTWWELSWDIMEPVTYMLTFGTALIGYTYFVLTGSEYTYEGLKKTLRERKLTKLIRRSGFDEEKFKRLQHTITIKDEQLHKILEDIRHSGVTPVNDISSPSITLPPPANSATANNKAQSA